jgi:hypothetical protein
MEASQRSRQTTVGRQEKESQGMTGRQVIRKQKAGMLANAA